MGGSCFHSWVDRPFDSEVAEVECFTELAPSFFDKIRVEILVIESLVIV